MTLFERVHMPSFAGATEWLGVEPLGPAESELTLEITFREPGAEAYALTFG